MYLFLLLLSVIGVVNGSLKKEKALYRQRVLDMFFHAYDNYMEHAYPADELMPLSCKGRVRGREPSRGDIDDSLGRFSLTLIDSLDTLAVIGAVMEFNEGIKRVINEVHFDADLTVSVFETNIRVLGGILGAHFAAVDLKSQGHALLQWYDNQLVGVAQTIADKLLPAFNTSTGLPYARINLRTGLNSSYGKVSGDTTCTACAGTLLMEFGALSVLTGNPIYESKAHEAMEALWRLRHNEHDLVGTVINVHNGKWTNKGSSVGAGIDSYYEYMLKSYILLGKGDYLNRFNIHYSAIKKYISNGPYLFEVNMNSPLKPSKHMMDSLLAFWPGLQVLWGDIRSAVSTHNLLYDIMLRHKFLPEGYSTDFKFRAVWPQHPLRPELIESTYFLYKATNDPFYIEVGKAITDNLNTYARVPCGFASIKDVQSNVKEDRLDSYFLAETLKYLYLLFTEDKDIVINLDNYILTTEAHLIPLSLSPLPDYALPDHAHHILLSCPNVKVPWVEASYYYYMWAEQCPGSRHLYSIESVIFKRRRRRENHTLFHIDIRSLDFSNVTQIQLLRDMGISVESTRDGKIMMTHNPVMAISNSAALEGAKLIQQVLSLTQMAATNNKRELKLVRILEPKLQERVELIAGPAQFGPDLGGEARYQVSGKLILPSSPLDGCDIFEKDFEIKGNIVLIIRGGCMFIHKVRNAQRSGAVGVIIYDNGSHQGGSSHLNQSSDSTNPSFPFSMSGDENMSNVHIPSLFISHSDGIHLLTLIKQGDVRVLLTWLTQDDINKHNLKTTPTNSETTSTNCPSGKDCKKDSTLLP